MKKKYYFIIIPVILTVVYFLSSLYFSKYESMKISTPSMDKGVDYKNATYKIDGKSVTLINGEAETEIAPGSASKSITKYFGNEVVSDLNNDGRPDIAFIITQTNGGSGTFYYAVAALNTSNGYLGSDSVLLGDRIAPQSTNMSTNPSQKNVIVFNYLDRNLSDSFTISPSVGKSIWLLLDTNTMQLGQVEQNFEGEADPSQMTLNMKKWIWKNTLYSDGKSIASAKVDTFTLTFSTNQSFSATTDCNSISGKYIVKGSKITFSDTISTMMYCDNSQESQFVKSLSSTESFLFTSKGELVLNLKMDSGSMSFK